MNTPGHNSVTLTFRFDKALVPLLPKLVRAKGRRSRSSMVREWLREELAEHLPRETRAAMPRTHRRVLPRRSS